MNSNQNNINDDFNCEQICKDCWNGFKSVLSSMPFFIRITVSLSIIFCIINIFTPYVSLYLADIPYFTIFSFQLWRLITTPFITTGAINLVFSLFFWFRHSVKLEKEKGTIKYMLTFFMFSFFIQLIYCLICLLVSLIIRNDILLKNKISTNGIRNDGLWPILMCDLTLLCLSNPEADLKFFIFPCIIKAKYYPLILFAFFTVLSNFSIDIELFCGIAFGFLYHYYLKNKIEISNNLALKVEKFFLCSWMQKFSGFISITNTGSSDIPTNLENKSNNSSNQQGKSFNAFGGKGISVGGSNNGLKRENVDYASLASRNTSDDSSESAQMLEVKNSNP